jgi:hypothetical protein
MSIGIGLAVNNARAVLEALAGKQSEFARTPEVPHRAGDRRVDRQEVPAGGLRAAAHRAVARLYFTFTVFYALSNGIYGTLPFLMLFQTGFLYTGLLSIVQQFADDGVALKTQVAGGD